MRLWKRTSVFKFLVLHSIGMPLFYNQFQANKMRWGFLFLMLAFKSLSRLLKAALSLQNQLSTALETKASSQDERISARTDNTVIVQHQHFGFQRNRLQSFWFSNWRSAFGSKYKSVESTRKLTLIVGMNCFLGKRSNFFEVLLPECLTNSFVWTKSTMFYQPLEWLWPNIKYLE